MFGEALHLSKVFLSGHWPWPRLLKACRTPADGVANAPALRHDRDRAEAVCKVTGGHRAPQVFLPRVLTPIQENKVHNGRDRNAWVQKGRLSPHDSAISSPRHGEVL